MPMDSGLPIELSYFQKPIELRSKEDLDFVDEDQSVEKGKGEKVRKEDNPEEVKQL